jgi:hypothetical protein
MMASQAYSTKNTWYVAYEVTGSPDQKKKYAGEVIQIPAVCGTAKSTNHKSNVLDLIKQMYPKATTLADIGITKTREAMLLQAIAQSYSVPQSNLEKEATRKRLKLLYTRREPLKQWQERLHKHSSDRRKRSWKRLFSNDASQIFLKIVGKSQKRLSQHESQSGKVLIC